MHPFVVIASAILLAGLRVGEVVARVNGQEIRGADFSEQLMSRYGRVALLDLIEDRLLDREVKAAKITADENEIERRVRAQVEEIRRQAGALEAARQMENVRHWLRRSYLIEELSRKRTQIPESEITAYYANHKSFFVEPEQIRVSDIVLDTKDNANQIRKLLAQGGDFAGLARRFSLDSASRDQGGDLGWLPLQSLALPLKQAALKLKTGAISDPIEVAGDWHMIKLAGRKPERQQALAEVRSAIQQRLFQEKLPMVRSGLIRSLRDEAEKLLPEEFRKPA